MPDAVAYLASGDIGSHGDDLADRLVAKDSRKFSRKVPLRLVHVGVANAAGVHLHQDLTRSGLRLRNIFDLPGTAHGGYDGGFHTISPWLPDPMRVSLRSRMILDARIAECMPKQRSMLT